MPYILLFTVLFSFLLIAMFLRSFYFVVCIVTSPPLSAAWYSIEAKLLFSLTNPTSDGQLDFPTSTNFLLQVPYESVSLSEANTQEWDFGSASNVYLISVSPTRAHSK